MGIPLVSEVADFFAALASGRDIGAVRGPTLFVVLHSVLLGCLCRPCVDARPDGKGPRHWLASLALFLTYILGGTTVTAALLGLRPCWMVDDRVWLFYALGWLLAGLLPVRRLVLQSPAKVCDSSSHNSSSSFTLSEQFPEGSHTFPCTSPPRLSLHLRTRSSACPL